MEDGVDIEEGVGIEEGVDMEEGFVRCREGKGDIWLVRRCRGLCSGRKRERERGDKGDSIEFGSRYDQTVRR